MRQKCIILDIDGVVLDSEFIMREILELGLAHNNENIVKMDIIDVDYSNKKGFPILQLEKDGIPFWFECPNVEIFNMENEKECEFIWAQHN